MPRIRQLPPDVVTKIAAGEVIERPASVVKELVENSVDAGSSRIDIDLEAGGTELIRVVDDGCGIEPDDLPLAFACHATSKLRDAADLFAIGTLGFRGEALASIAGVAQVVLQSRPRDRSAGAEQRCDGGVLSPLRPWNGSPGTRVEVRHLFYNVPVRKKFLKSVATELGHVCEVVTRLALAYPTLHLTLRHNGRLVYDVPASASRLDRIGLFFGSEVRDALFPVEAAHSGLRLSGYVADPKCDRGSTKLQYLFVNGRWVRDRSLGHALQEAYRGLLMSGRYAVAFLFLSVPPDQVDVNVHPTKAEVRFRENSLIYSLVRGAVKARLLKEDLVARPTRPIGDGTDSGDGTGGGDPTHDRNPRGPAPTGMVEEVHDHSPGTVGPAAASPLRWLRSDLIRSSQSNGVPARPAEGSVAPIRSPRAEAASRTVAPWDVPPSPSPSPVTVDAIGRANPDPFGAPADSSASAPQSPPPCEAPREVSAAPIGPAAALQVQDTYLVLETPEGMLVIDQHALHERILYEQLRRRIQSGRLEVQRLLIPEPIELPAEQHALVLEAADALKELGLEVSEFGGTTILLTSYPTLLARKPPHEILMAVVDHLVTKDRAPTREALLHQLMATMACKAAVKAGDRLTPDEIAHLLQLRQMAEDSHHCPHGRPTSLLFSRRELDRHFRRL